MTDNSVYRLRSPQEIKLLKEQYGDKFLRLQDAVHKYLKLLPCDVWIDFTKKTTEKNLPAFIKIICDYIDHNSTVYAYVEFNRTFTCIRRKEQHIIYNLIINDETKEKVQDDGCLCQ